jgi:hypothetical protein
VANLLFLRRNSVKQLEWYLERSEVMIADSCNRPPQFRRLEYSKHFLLVADIQLERVLNVFDSFAAVDNHSKLSIERLRSDNSELYQIPIDTRSVGFVCTDNLVGLIRAGEDHIKPSWIDVQGVSLSFDIPSRSRTCPS